MFNTTFNILFTFQQVEKSCLGCASLGEQSDKKNGLICLRCRGSGVEGMMKGIGIAILLMLLMSIGCATPYAQQWQSQLWQVKDNTTPKTELGKLEMEDVALGLLCTELRQVSSPSNAFIGINVSCRNQTDRTFTLEGNPIQVVNASQVLVKPLPLDHVMYKLYGGTLREQAQITQLAETSKPLVSSGSSALEDVLVAVVNTYRAQERHAIITEMHLKEALPYDLYYQSFTPTSLPPGVATVWTEYYPFTTDKITVMLQGQRVEDGITFGPPPPPPPDPEAQKYQGYLQMTRIATGLLLAIAIGAVIVVSASQ